MSTGQSQESRAQAGSFRLRSLAFVGLLLATGCAIGPDYQRPAVDAPPAFRGPAEAVSTDSLGGLRWWDVYQDDRLKELIRTALASNYDVRIALSRVEQARALEAQIRSQLFPQFGYSGTGARGRNALLGNVFPGNPPQTQNSFDAVFNAAWEVDLFGRVRRLSESARAEFLASEEARHGVQLSLVGDVATAYFELLELDKELEIARRTTGSFAESLRIFTERLQGGIASELETSRAQAALSTTAAVVPNLERFIALKENQISVLLGRNPAPVPRRGQLMDQALPPRVPAGLPSALLERRPDIRLAEQQLRAANAQIGVALGNFLPRIGLTTLYGGTSSELSAITAGSANAWSAAVNISGPLFQGGRLVGEYRQAKAAREEARLRYQQVALNAFLEVSNALLTRQRLEEVRHQQAQAVAAYETAVKVALQRYVAGKAGYYEVLEAQQQLFPAENALAQTQLNQLLAIVQLYKALGGGWEAAEPPPSQPSKERFDHEHAESNAGK